MLSLLGLSLADQAPLRIRSVNSTPGPQAPIGETINNGYTLALEDPTKKGIRWSS